MDGCSFFEVRRFGKRRRKFPMEELLKTNLLFPLVQSSCFEFPIVKIGQTIIVEIICGTGSIGRFEMEDFELADLELDVFYQPSTNQKLVLFTEYENRELVCLKDDFFGERNETDGCFSSDLSLI